MLDTGYQVMDVGKGLVNIRRQKLGVLTIHHNLCCPPGIIDNF